MGVDCLLNQGTITGALAKCKKCVAEIILCCGPFTPVLLAGLHIERRAKGGNGLLKSACAALAFAKNTECNAKMSLCHGPYSWEGGDRNERQATPINSDSLQKCFIVAKFVALVPKRFRLFQHDYNSELRVL